MVWLVLPWRESGWGLVLAGTPPQHRGSHIRFHTYFLNCSKSVSTPQFSYYGTFSSQGRVHFYSAQAQVWLAVARLMLSELSVVTDCAAVVLCTVFVQSVHPKLAVLYTLFTCAQVDGGGWYNSINCKLIWDLFWKAPCNSFDVIHDSIIIADQLSRHLDHVDT